MRKCEVNFIKLCGRPANINGVLRLEGKIHGQAHLYAVPSKNEVIYLYIFENFRYVLIIGIIREILPVNCFY